MRENLQGSSSKRSKYGAFKSMINDKQDKSYFQKRWLYLSNQKSIQKPMK